MPLEMKAVIPSRNNLEGVFDDPPTQAAVVCQGKPNLLCFLIHLAAHGTDILIIEFLT